MARGALIEHNVLLDEVRHWFRRDADWKTLLVLVKLKYMRRFQCETIHATPYGADTCCGLLCDAAVLFGVGSR
jgi:hypothetical protein